MFYELTQTCRHAQCSNGNVNNTFPVYFSLDMGLDGMPAQAAQFTYRCPHCRQSNYFQAIAFREVPAIPPGAIVATPYTPRLSSAESRVDLPI